MIKLQPALFFAASPGCAHERALSSVALPHVATDSRRDISDVLAAAPLARLRSGGEFLFLEFTYQCVQRALEHLRDVTGRQRMTKQRLRLAQLLLRLLVHREVPLETFRRKRCE